MRIFLSFTLPVSPDVAWEKLHSPRVAQELYAPLVEMAPRAPLPQRFTLGDRVLMEAKLFGLIPIGAQTIEIQDRHPTPDIRVMADLGGPVSGILSLLSGWQHEMAVSAHAGAQGETETAWHERLTFAGPAAPLFWVPLFLLWRWRGRKLRRMALSWQL